MCIRDSGWAVVPQALRAGGVPLRGLYARWRAISTNGVAYPVPVSYTQLDVYKRQALISIGMFISSLTESQGMAAGLCLSLIHISAACL